MLESEPRREYASINLTRWDKLKYTSVAQVLVFYIRNRNSEERKTA